MIRNTFNDLKIVPQSFDFDYSRLAGGLNPDKIIIHHTGSPKDEDISAEAIHRYHRDSEKWAGIGYHFVIRKSGIIEQGRPLMYIGAHCPGQNARSIGIHLSGNFQIDEPTKDQIESVAILCAGLCDKYNWEDPYNIIFGHRDFMQTACPGYHLYEKLPIIRGKTDFYMQKGW